MAEKKAPRPRPVRTRPIRRRRARRKGITALIVQNYKSLAQAEPYRLEVRPLTLLAGANSSGKSSALQPLLLLKQTLEANFDPGPLLLHGPHVRFTSTEQILPKGMEAAAELEIGLVVDEEVELVSCFQPRGRGGKKIELNRMRYARPEPLELRPGLGREELTRLLPTKDVEFLENLETELETELELSTIRRRCFLEIQTETTIPKGFFPPLFYFPGLSVETYIRDVIHLPGLRGNPERSYQTTAVGPLFPGTFETYVASIIHHWQEKKSQEVEKLGRHLERLGLTWKVESKQLDAAQVELKVGRLPHARRGGARDLVNITDVGFGVSQTLPVVVALLTARRGQLVYLEQPEIHLHPKAQIALAELLAEAAGRGVRVVAETHSALLLLAVQALVAEKKLPREEVILHWFQRGEDGTTRVTPAELDEQGAYGDWPEDFAEVQLAAQDRYMTAVEERLLAAVGD